MRVEKFMVSGFIYPRWGRPWGPTGRVEGFRAVLTPGEAKP